MIKKFMYGAISLYAFNSFAQQAPGAVPNIEWVEYYTERNQISNVPSAIDANNNAYITGYTFPFSQANQDATTVKYGPNGGAPLWVKNYDNGGMDNAKAIIVDASNVYITGESDGTGTGRDIFIVKYDALTGNQLFAFRWNGVANGHDVANAITLNPANGDIYVTGFTTNAGGTRDYVCIKLNNAGTQQFAVIFNGTGNLDDEATGIAFNNNRLYITGNATNMGGNTDMVTLRLNPNTGATLWTKTENGTANLNDNANAIVTDGNNVIVVGGVKNTGTGDDHITVKYNGATGSTLFNKQYDFGSTGNFATSVIVDATGGYAVTGIAFNGSIVEYHTLKYSATGTQQWVNKVSTGLTGYNSYPQIVTDPLVNHFYVCGQKSGVQSDILVYQITPGGNTSWQETFNGAQNSTDCAVDLVVNAQGVLYVAGMSLNSNAKFDYTTIKISQTPVYFPIDFNNANEANANNHYFYPNVGEVRDVYNQPATNVLFSTKSTYPQQFILNDNNLAFLLAKLDTSKTNSPKDSLFRVNLEFVKANKQTKPYPFEYKEDNVRNYFLSYVSPNPVVDNKGASRIMIPNIYPDIDLHYYSNQSGLKIYFVVKPGGDPNLIHMNFNGANNTSLSGNNDLLIKTTLGNFKFAKPVIYNVNMAMQTPPASGSSGWVSSGSNSYNINAGTYNSALPLVIQIHQGVVPTVTNTADIAHSTYFGNSGNDIIKASKISNNGFNFVCGSTTSPNLPLGTGQQNPFSGMNAGNRDGFITKFNDLIYYTSLLGGDRADECLDVEVDNNDEAFVVGITTSSVFPIFPKSGAFNKSTFVGPLAPGTLPGLDKDDGFIFQMNSLGNQRKWVTYYGGNDFDVLSDCRFDANGNFFVVGTSVSSNIPLVGSSPQYTQTFNTAQLAQDPGFSRVYDAIIMKFAATSHSLNWATYYGTDSNAGTTNISDDEFRDLDFDASNNVYVVGKTGGNNLPSKINNQYNTGNSTDGILVKFTNAGALLSAKHTQGTVWNNAVKIDNSKVYVCGMNSNTIATVDAGNYYYVSTSNVGGSAGSDEGNYGVYNLSLGTIHSSYIGGNGNDRATDLQFDSNNGIFYICGGSSSTNFTVVTPASTYSSNNSGGYDYFIMALKEGFTGPLWSTQLGTYGVESNFGNDASMSIHPWAGRMYLSGVTTSTAGYLIQYPSSGGYVQPTSAGGQDGTYTRFDLSYVRVVGVEEYSKIKPLFSVYPNPTDQYLHIDSELLNNKETTYSVYNMLGQRVATGKLGEYVEKTINVSHLLPGTYIVNFNSELKNYNTKFVKTN